MITIVFLVDTSASMNQRIYLADGRRLSLLELAKEAIQFFIKVRQKNSKSSGDHYMLFSSEKLPYNIKAGWKENIHTFHQELHDLKACDSLPDLGAALKSVFYLLNLNRMQTGFDFYGQGRHPYFLQSAIIIPIVNGGRLPGNSNQFQEKFSFPNGYNIPGAELTEEIFRWDQRIFSLVLRLPETPMEYDPIGLVPCDNSPLDHFCKLTGGRSYAITSNRMLRQCVEDLAVRKIKKGVVLRFEKVDPDFPSDKQSIDVQVCRKMIYKLSPAQERGVIGYWPIPDVPLPDKNASSLHPRTAHPVVRFASTVDHVILTNIAYDKYELEPCPLTSYILSRTLLQPSICWQVFVSNASQSSELGYPFGYLKANSDLKTVNLFVLPYNYPKLLPLLDELHQVHHLKPSAEWERHFANYLRTVPPYYTEPLRRALTRIGAFNLVSKLIPTALDIYLSDSIVAYLNKISRLSEMELNRICSVVEKKHTPKNVVVQSVTAFNNIVSTSKSFSDKYPGLREQVFHFSGFYLALQKGKSAQDLHTTRHELLNQLTRMRTNFFKSGTIQPKNEDVNHSIPTGRTETYREYLERIVPPLEPIIPTSTSKDMLENALQTKKRVLDSNETGEHGVKRPANHPHAITPNRKRKRKALKRK